MRVFSVLVTLVLLVSVDAQANTPDPGNEEGFKDLITANDLDENASFRCGIFFAGDTLNDKPREVVYILPKRFPTDCGSVKQEEVKAFCLNLFKRLTGVLTWKTTSKKRGAPFSIGDDVCDGALKKTGLKKPPPSPRFPDGVAIGFYYNYCKDIKWYDTELRVPQNLCCKEDADDPNTWSFEHCPGNSK